MKPRPVVRALALVAASVGLIGASYAATQSTPTKAQATLASATSLSGWHITGWQHGTTTTTTAPAPPPTAPPTTTAPHVVHVTHAPSANYAAGAGGFAACVRGIESTNNYGYSGYYHGAYNMTISHWGNYDGYARPEDAPPSVQDAKFASDVSQGSAYMHQQYPVSSRRCGM